MLWDLNEGKHLYSLEAGDIVNALVFSPNRYWLCAATASCVKIFDLESKCVLQVTLFDSYVHTTSLGLLWTSSSPTSLMLVPSRASLSVSRSPGLLTARLSSVVSPTTSSAFGPCRRRRCCFSLSESFFLRGVWGRRCTSFFCSTQTKNQPCASISLSEVRRHDYSCELARAIIFYQKSSEMKICRSRMYL